MQVELTVTDPDSVQIVGDLVMADHAPQTPAIVHQVTPMDDGIEWLVLEGSAVPVSLPPDTVVSSGIGFPNESDQTTAVRNVTEKDDLEDMVGEEEVITESLETQNIEAMLVQSVAEVVEDAGTFVTTPLYELQVGVAEDNESTDQDNVTSVVTSTESAVDIIVVKVVETSSSDDVTITEAIVGDAATSQNVVETTSSDAADVAPAHTTVASTEEASPGSLTTQTAVQASSPTTTTTSSTITSAATTPSPPTTTPFLTTTFPPTTVTKANLDVHINIKVHGALSEVEVTDPNENNIEATIDLITNSDDHTFPEGSDIVDDDDLSEIFIESEEDSELVNDELVCGGAYVLVRQRMICGGQLRHSLPGQNSLDGE